MLLKKIDSTRYYKGLGDALTSAPSSQSETETKRPYDEHLEKQKMTWSKAYENCELLEHGNPTAFKRVDREVSEMWKDGTDHLHETRFPNLTPERHRMTASSAYHTYSSEKPPLFAFSMSSSPPFEKRPITQTQTPSSFKPLFQ